jgi:hypothetical protein
MPERHGSHRRAAEDHHERPPDPAEEAGRPLEEKAAPEADPGPEHEPGGGQPPDPSRDPHHELNRPVGEPDPAADSDPYEPSE